MLPRLIVLTSILLLLAACAAPPRAYESRSHHGGSYSRMCGNCGRIESIERVYGQRQSSGGGAIIGAVIGGALGNQVGKGSGRRAATVAGAVAGGVIGNEIEQDRNRAPRFEVLVRMDDGRRLLFDLPDLGGLRVGDQVLVSGNRLSLR